MTDMTTHIATDTAPARRRQTAHMREYYVYFALIFAITVPTAVLTWGLKVLRQRRLPSKGPIKSAWSQAQIITPMIFSA